MDCFLRYERPCGGKDCLRSWKENTHASGFTGIAPRRLRFLNPPPIPLPLRLIWHAIHISLLPLSPSLPHSPPEGVWLLRHGENRLHHSWDHRHHHEDDGRQDLGEEPAGSHRRDWRGRWVSTLLLADRIAFRLRLWCWNAYRYLFLRSVGTQLSLFIYLYSYTFEFNVVLDLLRMTS